MAHWFEDNSLSIGHTPLVRLNRVIDHAPATVLAKIEGRNPAYSVKCRIGAAMIWDAEKQGLLGRARRSSSRPAATPASRWPSSRRRAAIPLTLTMPETMSLERRKLLIAFGAKLVLTEGAKGMNGAIAKAEEIAASDPDALRPAAAVQEPRQPGDPRDDHRARRSGTTPTAPSTSSSPASAPAAPSPASRATSSRPRASRSSRSRSSRRRARCSRRSCAGEPLKPGPHKIQGIGAGFIPDVLDLSLVDRSSRSATRRPSHYARRLAREEGILSGISCGAAVAVAARLAKQPENAGKTIVVILPDSGERYLSSVLFEGLFDAKGLAA